MFPWDNCLADYDVQLDYGSIDASYLLERVLQEIHYTLEIYKEAYLHFVTTDNKEDFIKIKYQKLYLDSLSNEGNIINTTLINTSTGFPLGSDKVIWQRSNSRHKGEDELLKLAKTNNGGLVLKEVGAIKVSYSRNIPTMDTIHILDRAVELKYISLQEASCLFDKLKAKRLPKYQATPIRTKEQIDDLFAHGYMEYYNKTYLPSCK